MGEPPFSIILELTRIAEPDDTHAFRFEPQDYALRGPTWSSTCIRSSAPSPSLAPASPVSRSTSTGRVWTSSRLRRMIRLHWRDGFT
jgi:hypothetical protein